MLKRQVKHLSDNEFIPEIFKSNRDIEKIMGADDQEIGVGQHILNEVWIENLTEYGKWIF